MKSFLMVEYVLSAILYMRIYDDYGVLQEQMI